MCHLENLLFPLILTEIVPTTGRRLSGKDASPPDYSVQNPEILIQDHPPNAGPLFNWLNLLARSHAQRSNLQLILSAGFLRKGPLPDADRWDTRRHLAPVRQEHRHLRANNRFHATCVETTDSPDGTSYLDLYLFKDNNGLISRRLYDKRDNCNFEIANYPFLDRNIPEGPAYDIYIFRLVAFARACPSLLDFNLCHKCLIKKLVVQAYNIKRFHSAFLKFGFRYQPSYAKYNTYVDDLWKYTL